jgi:hypothetical protein
MSILVFSSVVPLALSVGLIGGSMALAGWFYFLLTRHLFTAMPGMSGAAAFAETESPPHLRLIEPVRVVDAVTRRRERHPRAPHWNRQAALAKVGGL